MDEYTSQNKPGFNFTNFGKQSLVMAAICSVLIMNTDPAFAAISEGRVGGRSFSTVPGASRTNLMGRGPEAVEEQIN